MGMPRNMPGAAGRGGEIGALSAERLERRLRSLAWGEKQVLVAFLRHLAEFDRRRAYAAGPHSSLFQYCVREIGLSEDEAYLRILAARLGRDYPAVLDMLGSGQTHLSCLAKLSPHLTPENAQRLLDEARGKSKREVERIAARYGAPPPGSDSIRWIAPAAAQEAEAPGAEAPQLALGGSDTGSSPMQAPRRTSALGAAESPIAARTGSQSRPPAQAQEPQLVRIAFTASEELLAKIERAKGLLRHKFPTGRLELLVGAAFAALLDRCDPERRPSSRPAGTAGTGQAGARSRRIPRWVRDRVWRRDGGRCAFIAADGRRCPARDWLEYDHIRPFALGGPSDDPENIRLCCRTHNGFAAREIFGEDAMPRRTRAEPTRSRTESEA